MPQSRMTGMLNRFFPPSIRGWLLFPLPFVLIALAGCDSSSSPTPSPLGGTPPPEVGQANGDLGPLAVIEGVGGADALGGTGQIDIGRSCVTMTRSNGDMLLLVWKSSQVSWDEEQREIVLLGSNDMVPPRIKDGDVITIGGASLQDDQPVARELSWLATPDPSCAGEQWSVSSVAIP